MKNAKTRKQKSVNNMDIYMTGGLSCGDDPTDSFKAIQGLVSFYLIFMEG